MAIQHPELQKTSDDAMDTAYAFLSQHGDAPCARQVAGGGYVPHGSCVEDLAARIREAVQAEREACAKIAEDAREDEKYGHAAFRCIQIAQAIRARNTEAA